MVAVSGVAAPPQEADPRRWKALAVVLIYRLLTFWAVVIVGWISVGVIEWRTRHVGDEVPLAVSVVAVNDI